MKILVIIIYVYLNYCSVWFHWRARPKRLMSQLHVDPLRFNDKHGAIAQTVQWLMTTSFCNVTLYLIVLCCTFKMTIIIG